MIEAYPLRWPMEYPRTNRTRQSRFKTSLGRARDFVKEEVARIKGTALIISTNIPLKGDGDLRADWSRFKLDDMGVAVYFTRSGNQICLRCDTYNKVQDNLHAIGRTIEGLRQIDRDGVSDFLNRTFTGFKGLPEVTEAETDIWLTLGLNAKPDTVATVHKAYREKAKLLHPDMENGDEVSFANLYKAYRKALLFYSQAPATNTKPHV